jgi:hypothetical protein
MIVWTESAPAVAGRADKPPEGGGGGGIITEDAGEWLAIMDDAPNRMLARVYSNEHEDFWRWRIEVGRAGIIRSGVSGDVDSAKAECGVAINEEVVRLGFVAIPDGAKPKDVAADAPPMPRGF